MTTLDYTGFYFRLSTFHHYDDLPSVSPFYSTLPFEDFFEYLYDFNQENIPEFSNRDRQLGVVLTLMLPDFNLLRKEMSLDEKLTLAKEFAKKLFGCADFAGLNSVSEDLELPYSVYLVKRGSAEYLEYYVSDRYWKKNGFAWIKTYTKDYYINSETRRLTTKKDPQAIISHHKGDFISSEIKPFSKKTTLFMNSKKNFANLVEFVKQIYIGVCDKLTFHMDNTAKLPKISRERAHNKYQTRNVTQINKYATRAENELQKLYNDLLNGYFWDDKDTQKAFFKLRQKFRRILNTGKFKVSDKYSYEFTINTYWKHLDSALESFEMLFQKEYDQFVSKYLAIDIF